MAPAPCLIPAYLLSLYCVPSPPLQGSAFTASPSTAAAIKPRGLQLGVKGRSGAGGALTGEVLATSHGTAAEPPFSLHQLIGNPGSSENSCPAGHRDTRGFGTAVRGESIPKTPLLPQQAGSSTQPSAAGEGPCPPGGARGTGSHVISSDSSFDPDLPISRGVHRALHKHGGDARRRNL